MATISLPTGNRTLAPYTTGEPIVLPKKGAARNFNRSLAILDDQILMHWHQRAMQKAGRSR